MSTLNTKVSPVLLFLGTGYVTGPLTLLFYWNRMFIPLDILKTPILEAEGWTMQTPSFDPLCNQSFLGSWEHE